VTIGNNPAPGWRTLALVATLCSAAPPALSSPPPAPGQAAAPAPTPDQAASTALTASPSAASPSAADPLLQLLLERGAVQAGIAGLQPAVALAQQARDRAAEAVMAALAFLDLPYVRGGNSAESGFDCSGFTRYVFKHTVGLLLPRSAEQQAQTSSLQPVPADQLKPGDLVFFNTLRKAFSHVGIYVGDGRFVHSPRVGGVVRVENMRQTYWATRFDGARRALVADAAPASQAVEHRR
jgi:cell wall-associated NlpC family hydrolase